MAGRVAQWIEHLPSKQMVGSSILSSVIFFAKAQPMTPATFRQRRNRGG